MRAVRTVAVALLGFFSIPTIAQISNVECGDASTGIFIACPVPPAGANPTVTAGGIDTSFPSTGAYVDFTWTTPDCSSSIVVYMPDTNYAPMRYWQGNTGGRDGCNAGYAKNHSVHANYLGPAYTGLNTPAGLGIAPYASSNHFFYVASQDQTSGSWATLGGPNRSSGYPFGVISPVPNTSLSSSWGVWLYGAQNVYQGHDLYVAALTVLAQGQVASSVVMPYSSVQFTRQTLADGSECVSNCTDSQDGTVLNLDVSLVDTQQYANTPQTDYVSQFIDNINHRDYSYGGNYRAIDNYQFLRVRTNCNGHGSQAACGAASPTPAGRYQVTVNLQPLRLIDFGTPVGPPITVTYIFTVLPPATFTATPPACLGSGSCPAVPCISSGSCGGYSYEDFIKTDGVLACTGGPATFPSRLGQDYQYSQGIFDNGNYNASTATGLAAPWNYDGGRTFWQMSDYAAANGWATPPGASLQPNGTAYPDAASYYHHCALVAQQAYYNYFGGVGAAGTAWPGGQLREWNIFPNGPAMTWWRTGDPAAKQAALNLGSWQGTGGAHQGSTIYQYYPITSYDAGRQSAYQLDSISAAWQINGSISNPDQLQLSRIVDTILGGLDQVVNYDPYGVNYQSTTHPQTFPYGVIWRNYMLGVSLEALIEYYEWQGIVGQPQDQRIPVAIKATLDFMWTNLWAFNSSGYYAFYYNGVDIPHNSATIDDNYPELNNLVCGAYAWYWKESGDDTYLTEGDACFQNGIGQVAIGHIYYTGKDVDQIGKWASDYIGYRTVNGYTSAIFPANNSAISVPDTVPPVPRPMVMTNLGTTDSPPDIFTGVKPVTNIGSTSVTVSWSTYKPLVTATVEYGLTSSYGSSATGASTNCAGIAACSVGCQATVGAQQIALCEQSYWNVVNITGLSPNTTYHFRTKGVDANGNTAVSSPRLGRLGSSQDFTFVTGH
jgi:hypothetical protein